MMVNFLVLVKHSIPEIIPGRPACEWRLSLPGRQRCSALAAALQAYTPDLLVSSMEPKAQETAEITAHLLGKPTYAAPGLHEHERRTVAWQDRAQFELNVANFFQYPDQLVMGEETANQAYQRFKHALDGLLAHYSGRNFAVVAHGTVITLIASRVANMEPFPLWRQLGLPGVVVLSHPDLELVRIIPEIG